MNESFDPSVCTRILTLKSGDKDEKVHVAIGPLKKEDGHFSCHVEISNGDRSLDYQIHGMDGVQAMQLALRFVGSELDRLAGPDGIFDCFGETRHGFDRILQESVRSEIESEKTGRNICFPA